VKWILIAALTVVFSVSAYLIHVHVRSTAEKSREKFYTVKLRQCVRDFSVGSTRKEIEAQLNQRRMIFHQICCLHGRGSVLADLVKIGEEKGSWYCNGLWVNVAFDFRATEQHDPLRPADSDVLDEVKLYRESDGCL
jgi:hypothetical protein